MSQSEPSSDVTRTAFWEKSELPRVLTFTGKRAELPASGLLREKGKASEAAGAAAVLIASPVFLSDLSFLSVPCASFG